MKRFISSCIIFTTIITNNLYASTDSNIFKDEINKTYTGIKEATPTITNIKFNDVAANYWAKPAIVKAGALNMVKGYNQNYNPTGKVSNQEALAFLIRVAGLEQEAQALGENLKNTGFGDSTLQIWSLGYLTLAKNLGLITNDQYNQAITQDEASLDSSAFKRSSAATREQVASWAVQILNSIREVPLQVGNQQYIYNFSDWQNISSEHINNVEICLANGIMKGSDGKFNPKGSLTRAEMAQLLVNMESIYNEAFSLTQKYGTIAGIKDEQTNQDSNNTLVRNIYIRNNQGKVDVIQYQITNSSSPQAYDKDVVVYNNGAVTGLASLKEGNKIEYLVNDTTNEAIFVNVTSTTLTPQTVFGQLKNVNYETGQVEIQDSKGKSYIYYAVDGLISKENGKNYLYIERNKKEASAVPIGSHVNLKLNNSIITQIEYVGQATLSTEINGVVIENNNEYSYLTIVDSKGNQVTKNYYSDDIVVEKQEYYDTDDEIGYIDEVFPNFKYDPRDTTIDKIEVGDIVFIKTKIDDKDTIDKISAVTNYSSRYGKISQLNNNGMETQILVEYENGQTNWFEFSNNIFISKAGKPVTASSLSTGDWVRLLVNEATIGAGEIIESVKEIVIEEQGHLIGDIIKGNLGTIDPIQNNISINNAYTLTKDGWSNHKDIIKLSINNNDVEYYYEDNRVSLDYFNRNLKYGDGQVYIALEDNYSGNVISKITYRTGRDELLDTSFVTDTNGSTITTNLSEIKLDSGTIVRKDGKLVNHTNINSYDYARVSLNGNGKAAVVDIYDAPTTSTGITILRGRVSEINENKSFKVSSLSQLSGNSWSYSPVERTFSIDANTLFITNNEIKKISEFIGYTDNSSLGKVFTIIYDGTKATHIIESPHATKVVGGTIYNKLNNEIKLKNGKYINSKGIWENISNVNTALDVGIENNTIIIKNNEIVSIDKLENGDKIRVFTETLPEIKGGMKVTGRIILVEN